MPLIKKSSYNPQKFLHKKSHLSTIWAGKFKKYPTPNYTRERLELDDGDFLDLDWLHQQNQEKLLILSHGLEGDSRRTYINSCADYFYHKGFSILAWNQRSCSGELNRLPRLYHHGVIDDLERVVNKGIKSSFKKIYLVGFSMGGAVTLNYLGGTIVPKEVKSAAVFSVPISLQSSANKLKKGFNTIYLQRFINKLKPKLMAKAKQFPTQIDASKIKDIKNFDEIDDYFTAPLHGFLNKEDYYTKASPTYVLDKITTPVLVVNACNDSFLGKDCYPLALAKNHKYLYLETPQYGGHCAFLLANKKNSWADLRAFEFFFIFTQNLRI